MNTYDKTLETLETYGHHKGDFYADKHRPFTSAACLVGALHRASGTVMARYKHFPEAGWLLADIISEQFPDRLTGRGPQAIIPDFNDHEDTTLADIILVCEKASIMEDERVK